jgi:hypothetical protein
MRFRHFFTFFLGIVLALTLVPAAQAANLFIDDSVEAQITLNHDANWEFGVLSNGTPFPGSVAGSTTAPGEVATFSGSWRVNSPGNPDPGTGTIYFVDQAAKAAKKGGKKAGKKVGRKDSCKRRKRSSPSSQECLCQRHRHGQLEHRRGQPLRQSDHLFHDHFKRMWPEPGSLASTLRRPRSFRPGQPD